MSEQVKRAAKRTRRKFPSYSHDRSRFRGEYVVTVGDCILAHGKDARVVWKEAEKYVHLFDEEPTLAMIPLSEWMFL